MKFSIIIPVYNTEKYLEKCLNSVFKQNYKNFEVIIVNDGSTDNSELIIKKYIEKYKNIKYIKKENEGLSVARNIGILSAIGEYFLFLDSDDYYEPNILKELSNKTKNNPDIIRFQIKDIYENNAIIEYSDCTFKEQSGIESFNKLCQNHYVEVACSYCYRRNFWLENNFKFKANTYHEDFGLIPLVLIKSNKTCSIPVFGYNYMQRNNSITHNKDYEKTKKKANDFLDHFEYLQKESKSIKEDLSVFNSYIANSVILKSTTLKYNDYKQYTKKLKQLKAFDMILADTIARKTKKIFLKTSPKIYYKIVGGKIDKS